MATCLRITGKACIENARFSAHPRAVEAEWLPTEPRDLRVCGFQALCLRTHTGGPCPRSSPSVGFPRHPQDNYEDCSGGGVGRESGWGLLLLFPLHRRRNRAWEPSVPRITEPVSGTWEIPSQACVSRGCLLAHQAFLPVWVWCTKGAYQEAILFVLPHSVGDPRKAQGSQTTGPLVCSLDCLLACLPTHPHPNALLRLELSLPSPLSFAASGLLRPFPWTPFTTRCPAHLLLSPPCTVLVSPVPVSPWWAPSTG